MLRVALAVAAVVISAACEAGNTAREIAVQMPGDDAVVTTHAAGPLDLSVRRPGTLGQGVARFEVTVEEGGAPVSDLAISATSEMSAMDHDQTIEPRASDGGTYVFDVVLAMPGDWALTFTVTDGRYGGLLPVVVEFEVPAGNE